MSPALPRTQQLLSERAKALRTLVETGTILVDAAESAGDVHRAAELRKTVRLHQQQLAHVLQDLTGATPLQEW